MHIVAALLLSVSLFAQATPVCTVGSGSSQWSGSPADLAAIEARFQLEQAEAAGAPFPNGAATPSPWSALVRCSTS